MKKLSKKLGEKLLKAVQPYAPQTPAEKLIAALCQAVDAYRREVSHVRKQYSETDVTNALHLVAQGMSMRKAAKAAGVTFHAVWSAQQRLKAASKPR